MICDVFAPRKFQGNQLAVFPDAGGLTDSDMQTLAREIHFSESSFILSRQPTQRGFPVRIFTPAREVPFAGHPTLGTAYVIWERFLDRKVDPVRLDLKVGVVPVQVYENGERLMMTQVPPRFGKEVEPAQAAGVLGLQSGDIDSRYPCQEVSTGLWFLIVPVTRLASVQAIKVNLAEYYRLLEDLDAKAVLTFCPETIDPRCRLHVRVFCDFYGVPEDPATGSANGCLCAWLSKHRYLGASDFSIATEQGVEMQRESLLYLEAEEKHGRTEVRVGGRVFIAGHGVFG